MNEDLTAENIEKDLIELHGYVIGNEKLCAILGFQTMGAFRQAISKKRIPIAIFDIDNRRGKFALAKDVASWLYQQRQNGI